MQLVSQRFCFAFVHFGLTGIAGFSNGVGANARFSSPGGLAVDTIGTALLVADTSNHCVRRISLADASVTTVAGSAVSAAGFRDAAGTAALFNAPVALVLGACWMLSDICSTNYTDYSNYHAFTRHSFWSNIRDIFHFS